MGGRRCGGSAWATWIASTFSVAHMARPQIGFCSERIARFKVPRHVRFVREWPMSATKIQKGLLRERLITELNQTDG